MEYLCIDFLSAYFSFKNSLRKLINNPNYKFKTNIIFTPFPKIFNGTCFIVYQYHKSKNVALCNKHLGRVSVGNMCRARINVVEKCAAHGITSRPVKPFWPSSTFVIRQTQTVITAISLVLSTKLERVKFIYLSIVCYFLC